MDLEQRRIETPVSILVAHYTSVLERLTVMKLITVFDVEKNEKMQLARHSRYVDAMNTSTMNDLKSVAIEFGITDDVTKDTFMTVKGKVLEKARDSLDSLVNTVIRRDSETKTGHITSSPPPVGWRVNKTEEKKEA